MGSWSGDREGEERMVILKFALMRSLRNPIAILAGFVLPIMFMFISDMWLSTGAGMIEGRGYFMIPLVMLFGTFPLTQPMARERREKIVVRIMSTPTTTFKYLAQNLIACMIPLLIQVMIVCTLGAILHDWTASFILTIGALYLLFAATSVSFNFAWNCLFKNAELSFGVLAGVLTFAAFILMLPLALFPDAIRTAFMILPTYWIASGLDELLTYGTTAQLGISMGILGLFSVIFLLYGSKRGTY